MNRRFFLAGASLLPAALVGAVAAKASAEPVLVPGMRIEGGNAIFTGTVRAAGWPIALKAVEWSCRDGHTINFGGDLGRIPEVILLSADGLAPLGRGEGYHFYKSDLSPTGVTVHIKIRGVDGEMRSATPGDHRGLVQVQPV